MLIPREPFQLDFFTYYGNTMPARDLDVENMTLVAAKDEVMKLRTALRVHMNMRGDDRCTGDDHELYLALPEGDTRPEKDSAVTLENCALFIKCRQTGERYVSPQRYVEELEAKLKSQRELFVKYMSHVLEVTHNEQIPKLGDKDLFDAPYDFTAEELAQLRELAK